MTLKDNIFYMYFETLKGGRSHVSRKAEKLGTFRVGGVFYEESLEGVPLTSSSFFEAEAG